LHFLFYVPKMAVITSIIARTTDVDLIKLAVIGNVIAARAISSHKMHGQPLL